MNDAKHQDAPDEMLQEWQCWDCGLKFYFTEPVVIGCLQYCPDCVAEREVEL